MTKPIQIKYIKQDKNTKRQIRRIFIVLYWVLIFNVLIVFFLTMKLFDIDVTGMLSKAYNNTLVLLGNEEAKVKSGDLMVTHLMFAGHSNPTAGGGNNLSHKEHCSLFADSLDGMTGYYGIDVSHWQNHINWQSVHSDTVPQKLHFFIIKATQGQYGVDKFYTNNFEKAGESGGWVGAYHFYISDEDPVLQANNYIRTAQLKAGNLRPIVDVELDGTNGKQLEVSKSKFIADLKTYIQEIEKHYHLKPIIYTYPSFYNTHLKGEFHDYPFWISAFSKLPPPGFTDAELNDSVKTMPKSLMWQFSNNEMINGIVGRVDMSFMPSDHLKELVIQYN